jgi:multiple antibiotic resistance protein
MMPMETLPTLLKTLVSLLAVVDPLGAIPLYLTLSAGLSTAVRRRTAHRAALATFAVLFGSALAGRWVLELFGISLASVKAAGGVLFLFMGLEMLNARPSRSRATPEETEEAEERHGDIAIVPLALPMLAGPGAIGSVILLADRRPLWPGLPEIALILAVVCGAAWLCLFLAGPIGKRLGVTGLNILSRLMGLIVMAIAIEFLVGGVAALWRAQPTSG